MGTTTAVLSVRNAVEGRGASGAREAFRDLVQRLRPGVLAVCLRATGDPDVARQVTREVIRRVLFGLPQFAGGDPGVARSRILGLARVCAVEAVRQRGDLLLQDGVIEPGSEVAVRLLSLSLRERETSLAAALASLEDPLREAAHLRYVQHLPHAAISSWLNDRGVHRLLARDRLRIAAEIGRMLA